VGGIVDYMKKDAAWGPIRRGDDTRPRRMFRDEKLNRRGYVRNAINLQGDETKKRGDPKYDDDEVQQQYEFAERMIKGRPRRRRDGPSKTSAGQQSIKHGQSKNNTTTSKRMILEDSKRGKTLKTKQVVAKRNHNIQRPQLRLFRPHPIREKTQSSTWSLSLPGSIDSIKFDRLVILDGNHDMSNEHESTSLKDWLVHESSNEINNTSVDEELANTSETVVYDNVEECVPMSEWQTIVHPTCNSLHEMNIPLLLHDDAFSLVSNKGHWRSAWKVDMTLAEANGVDSLHSPRTEQSKGHNGTAVNKYTVVKSLKYIHEPNEEIFELGRVEAIALDVLTPSRFTINIYGYCGSSSVQEFAGGDLKGLLPKLDPIDKLRMATWLANGVADIHGIDSLDSLSKIDMNNDPAVDKGKIKTNRSDVPVPLIHNDINMDNVLLGYRDGVEMPILNDFNIAVFRKKHAQTGEPCRFHGRFANPQWMSPEQQERPGDFLSTGYLNEKIDIYALGNIFYKIAVGNSPWKYNYKNKVNTPEIKAKIKKAKLQGAKPRLPPEVRDTNDPSLMAVLTAMDRCYRNDVKLRPSARELANYLKMELDAVELPLTK